MRQKSAGHPDVVGGHESNVVGKSSGQLWMIKNVHLIYALLIRQGGVENRDIYSNLTILYYVLGEDLTSVPDTM